MQNQLLNNISPAFGGPYGLQAYLVPPSQATATYEGPWIPLAGLKALSIEFAGAGATFTADLYGTNDPLVAAKNGYTFTFGGSVSNGDTQTATFTNPNLPNGSKAIQTTAGGSDTTATLATAMAAAINADADLQSAGIGATSAAAVVTIVFPSVAPESAVPSAPPSVGGSAVFANFTGVAGTKTGTATVAVATLTNGTKLNASSIAALGFLAAATVPFPPIPLYIKARLTALSGAAITVSLNGST
jgi:hypothetical protein